MKNEIKWRFFNHENGELIDPTAADFVLSPHELVEGAQTWDDVLVAARDHEIAVLEDHAIIESDEVQEKYFSWAIGESGPVVNYSRAFAMNTAISMQDYEPLVPVVVIDVQLLEIVEFFPAKTELYVCDNTEWLRLYHLGLSEREEIIEDVITEYYCTKLIEELEERGFYAHTDHRFRGCHEWNGAQSAKYKSGAIMSFDNIEEFELQSIDEAEDLVRRKTEAFTEERLASIEVIE